MSCPFTICLPALLFVGDNGMKKSELHQLSDPFKEALVGTDLWITLKQLLLNCWNPGGRIEMWSLLPGSHQHGHTIQALGRSGGPLPSILQSEDHAQLGFTSANTEITVVISWLLFARECKQVLAQSHKASEQSKST